MSIFKIARCVNCNRRFRYKYIDKYFCPSCDTKMVFSKKWYVSFYFNNKKITKAVSAKRIEAEKYLLNTKKEIYEGTFGSNKKGLVWEEAKKFFILQSKNSLSNNTIIMYKNSFKKLDKYLSNKPIEEITPKDIENYKTDQISLGKTNSTINRDIAAIKRLFSFNMDLGTIEKNNIAKIKLFRENPARDRFLSTEEISRVKEALKTKNNNTLSLAFKIAIDTGLRKNDVYCLKWSEVDFENDIIIKKNTKCCREVRIPITKRLKEALRAHKKDQSVLSPYILSCNGSGPPKDLRRAFSSALREANIKDYRKFRWHDLRRTFASHFIMATRDLVALQNILGHKSFETTRKHYAHLIDEHISNAFKEYETNT